jgi:DNA-binding NarL/FixJ family response regulator
MEIASGPHRVLIVDDADTVRESLRWLLENETGLLVAGEAQNGSEAIVRAAELAPDLVILDIGLPGLDGYAVARALKALLRPPAVIFLTAHGSDESQRRAKELGADSYVEKSQGATALLTEIRRVLAARER